VTRLLTALVALVVATGAAAFPPPAEIGLAELPPEARHTVALIRSGGPFPYDHDGAVFGNREARLPAQPRGYYREYTVRTPGARDRGARRIVAGRDGELYYTGNHYRSFTRIRE
jgi:ribonuclease T1